MIFMVRCPRCGKENYLMNVALGICTWCRYKATEQDVKNDKTGRNVFEKDMGE